MFTKLPLNALRSFESLARLGSLKTAAYELSVTPAAVSQQIKQLESWVGAKLFHRLPGGLALTDEGRLLYKQVHQSFGDLASHLHRFKPDADSSLVRVTTTPSFAALWLIPRLGDFYKRFPGHSVQIEVANEIIDLERDNRFDVALRSTRRDYPELYQVNLMQEEFGVFLSPSYAKHLEGLSYNLIDMSWYGKPDCPASWSNWCSKAGCDDWLNNARYIEYSDEHYALQAAISAQGYILASMTLAEDSVQRGLLLQHRPDITLQGDRFLALCLPGRERRRTVRDFLDWITAQANRQGL